MDNDLKLKIQCVINSETENIKQIEEKLNAYSSHLKTKENNIVELQKYSYNYIKYNNEIKRKKQYIERCKSYIEYLDVLPTKNEILIKNKEYKFINQVQNEAFIYFESKINEMDYLRTLQISKGQNPTAVLEKEEYKEKQQNAFELFTEGFKIEEDKIYTATYLDYQIETLLSNINNKKRKAS